MWSVEVCPVRREDMGPGSCEAPRPALRAFREGRAQSGLGASHRSAAAIRAGAQAAGWAGAPNRESDGNRRNSASSVLKTVRDLIGVWAALEGEETVPCAVQLHKPCAAPAGINYGEARTG